MSNTFGVIDILIAAGGFYLIWSSVQMKRTGEIGSSAMVGKGYDLKKAKDPKGYIDYMYLKNIVVGILVILSSLFNYLNDAYWKISYFGAVICIALLAVIAVYCFFSVKAQKKFLSEK